MKTEDNNKYTVIFNYYVALDTYKYKAIYKYKRNIYKFIYHRNKESVDETNGIYQLTNNGWVRIEERTIVEHFAKVFYDDYYTWANKVNVKDDNSCQAHIEYCANQFFEGCVKYINFLLS